MKAMGKGIIAGLVTLVVSLMIFERKLPGNSTTDEPEMLSVEEFANATPDCPPPFCELFRAGTRSYLLGDAEGARTVFTYLRGEFPGNEVVEHNFRLSGGQADE